MKSCSPLSGALSSPSNEGQTSTWFNLDAYLKGGCYSNGSSCLSNNYSGVTFEYRVGTSGSFASIPASDVSAGGTPVSWPATTSVISDTLCSGACHTVYETDSPAVTWLAFHTITSTSVLQIQAVFNDTSGDTYTTSPVTVSLITPGTGGDFATTQVGPATVGLQSGNVSLTATDVSIASYRMSLAVSRTFNNPTQVNSSGAGPGWTLSVPVLGTTEHWASVSNGGSYAVLTDSGGTSYTFAAGTTSGGVTPYTAQGNAAAAGLTLTLGPSGYTLTNPSGEEVSFTAANSSTPTYYTPSQASQPGSSHAVGYLYDETKTDASYGRLELMVAPDAALPAGTANTTACPYPASASTWSAGCRGLQFSYNSSGNVSQISFESADGTNLTSTPVAAYGYDSQGRLVQEWDPRISPNLITTYTYDETTFDPTYGFLTSVSPAQATGSGYLQPWIFTYNTTASSQDYLKVTGVSRYDSRGTGTQTIDYEVPLTTAAGGPLNMDATTAGTWNQTDVPASAVAIFPATHVPASPPSSSDWQYAQITYYDANGMAVNTANFASGSWDVSTTQYDAFGDVLSALTAADRAEALAAGSSSASVAAELETVSQYTQLADGSEEIAATYGPLHNADVAGVSGIQQVRDLTTYTYDQGAPNGDVAANGLPYQLVTTKTQSASIGAGIPGTASDDPRTTTYAYSNGGDNTGWTIYSPLKTTTDPSGLAITHTTQYNENASLYGGDPLVIAGCMPSDTPCSGAGTQRTIYYTGGSNPLVSACGNQPVWANLVCETEPAAQPGTAGLPNLAVTAYTYNVYLQPLTKTQTFGSSTRIYTGTYDTAGRQTGGSITTSGPGMGTAVPQTQTVYSQHTGLVTDQETISSTGTVTADINSGYDDFGELTSYTDATSNVSTYSYDLGGRVTSRSDGKGTVTISYGTGGQPVSEADSQAGTQTATFNPDGRVATETYPGGVVATYGYDETGTATSLSYAGTDWTAPLTDSATPNAFGSWASQTQADVGTALLSSQTYNYDNADRLTSVQDTQAGQCTTRTYAYNSNSDRTSLASAIPGSGGACTSTNPTTETYSYDSADRITNSGYTYDAQGDITATPAVDAGGSVLTATYYANNTLASQTQGSQSTSWTIDPTEQRDAYWVSAGVTTAAHYSYGANNPTWISGSDGTWTRYVTDVNGLLAEQVSAAGATLELPDLHGDIFATASTSATATGPTATTTYNEFGGTESGNSGSYGWLGGDQISSDALGGTLLMGARAYSTIDGRFDQVDPIRGGSANAYDYTSQNPVTGFDLTGFGNQNYAWCTSGSAGNYWFGSQWHYCEVGLDNYWTVMLIDSLNWAAAAGAACAAATWWIPFIDVAVTAFCAVFSGLAWLASATLNWINDAGGHQGIYFAGGFTRVYGWFFGRWYSPWIPWGYVWAQ